MHLHERLEKAWLTQGRFHHTHCALTFTDRGLELGNGTLVTPLIKDAYGRLRAKMKNACKALLISTGMACVLDTGSVRAADINPSPIAFPGTLKATTSPSGHYEVQMKRLADENGAPTYRLILQDLMQHRRQNIVTFQRSVTLTWRTDAEGFFLNEYSASNFSDCLVAVPGKQMEFRSLLERLAHHPELGVSESPDTAHFYVECKSWNTANQIAVSVFGHTDEDAKEFSYSLTYDIQKDLLQK